MPGLDWPSVVLILGLAGLAATVYLVRRSGQQDAHREDEDRSFRKESEQARRHDPKP